MGVGRSVDRIIRTVKPSTMKKQCQKSGRVKNGGFGKGEPPCIFD